MHREQTTFWYICLKNSSPHGRTKGKLEGEADGSGGNGLGGTEHWLVREEQRSMGPLVTAT